MKTIKLIGMTLLATLFCLNFAACSSDDSNNGAGNTDPNNIVGTWQGGYSSYYYSEEVTITFYENGRGTAISKMKEYGYDSHLEVEKINFEYEMINKKEGIAYVEVDDDYYDETRTFYFYIRSKRLYFDDYVLEKVGYNYKDEYGDDYDDEYGDEYDDEYGDDYDDEYGDDYDWNDDYYYW